MDDNDVKTLHNILEGINSLHQHVNGPTHVSGHMLDLIITRDSDDLVSPVEIFSDMPSDHWATMLSEITTAKIGRAHFCFSQIPSDQHGSISP